MTRPINSTSTKPPNLQYVRLRVRVRVGVCVCASGVLSVILLGVC